MIKILINVGAKLDICNRFGDTAISLANKLISSNKGYWKDGYTIRRSNYMYLINQVYIVALTSITSITSINLIYYVLS